MAQEFAEGAKSSIKGFGLNQIIDIEVYKESPDMAIGNCSGIMYFTLFPYKYHGIKILNALILV